MSTRKNSLIFVLVLALWNHSAIAAPDQASLDLDAAKRAFAEGAAAYEAGNMEDAAVAFRRGALAYPNPKFAYNLGLCLDRLGRWAEAVTAYQEFIRDTPKTLDRDEAEARVLVLQARLTSLQPPKPAVVRAPEPVELTGPQPSAAAIRFTVPPHQDEVLTVSRRWVVGPVALSTATLAVLGAGLGVTLQANTDFVALRASSCGQAAACSPAQTQNISRQFTTGYALLGVGAAGAVGSALYWYFGRPTRGPKLSPVLTQNTAGISFSGTF